MDLLTGNIRTLYFKFLSAAFGSALISCIYGMVDMAMVGQYQGPDGAAALAVVAPVWNIIYSLGLLTGIGGSVLFSARRGGGHAQGEDNQYFTAAVVGSGILAVLSWAWILLFEREVLLFFGADETLLPLGAGVSCAGPLRVPGVPAGAACDKLPAKRRKTGACHGGSADRRHFQCVWRLVLRVRAGPWRVRRRACHGDRRRDLACSHVFALFLQKMHAASGACTEALQKTRRNCCHRLFQLLCRRCHGHSHGAF